MAILQAGVAIGGTLVKGINALVDAKRVKSFNYALKMVTANVELTHQRLTPSICQHTLNAYVWYFVIYTHFAIT